MARDFNGTSDYIVYPYQGVNWNASAQTIAVRLSLDSVPASNGRIITEYTASDASQSFQLFIATTSQQVSFTIVGGTNLLRRSVEGFPTTTETLLTVTHDGSTTASNCHIYFDGAEVTYSATDNGVTPSTTGGSMALGDIIGGATREYDGRMSEFARWNRVLSSSERAMLVARYSPLCLMQGLKSYIPFIRGTQDFMRGAATTVGGTTVTAHPRIVLPAPYITRYGVTAVAGGAHPVGPLGHPFHGPFGGPIG